MRTLRTFTLLLLFSCLGCGGDDDGLTKPDGADPNDNGGGGSTMFLKDYAGFKIGNIVSAQKLGASTGTELVFKEVLNEEFNSVTAENDMKMANIFTGPNQFDWSDGDAIVSYAKSNGLRVHGHALIWHHSVPNWLSNFSGTDEEFESLIEEYIKATVSHFAMEKDGDGNSIVAAWDVVNEAIDGTSMRNSLFKERLGDDYVKKCFTWAREADPDVKLFYNDYNIAGDPAKRSSIISLVNVLKSENLIDGVGMQMHVNHNWPSGDLPTAIQDIANSGLLVHVSELDVKVNYNNDVSGLTGQRAEEQADQYQNVAFYYTTLVPVSQQYGITLWGFRDQDSWIYIQTDGKDWPAIYNNNFSPKKAYYGFVEGLKGNSVN